MRTFLGQNYLKDSELFMGFSIPWAEVQRALKLQERLRPLDHIGFPKRKAPLLMGRADLEMASLLLMAHDLGKPVWFLNWDAFVSEGGVCSSSLLGGDLELKFGQRVLLSSKVRGGYISRPLTMEISSVSSDFVAAVELGRWRLAWDQIVNRIQGNVFPSQQWTASAMIQEKAQHLVGAQKLGFKTPRTVLTNSRQDALRFTRKCKFGVLLRDFSRRVFEKGAKDLILPVERLALADVGKLNFKNTAPLFFQEWIPHTRELRVLVINSQVFAFEISTPPKPIIDWRVERFDDVKILWKEDFPTSLKRQILRFTSQSGLEFASLDFLVGPRDDLIFLEVNQPGKWLFLEAMTGAPLRRTILNALRK